eukprot:CAMPEP_0113550260 /NCGR_PEP_ID=MMETSP0015_2-20120614/13887_1 /TAXON_ID=2838 /ORGANISM="Odontella" /LENGTH=352 /DNA_ID=CAMNT_0000451055 /DNA_START=454 /DNA_END=1512 /DNA_ORIENTATION=+ /assembly_acc=CAM_ASM_000160
MKTGINEGNFCVPWEVDMDSWWTHAPDWDVTAENDVGLCFSREVATSPRANYLRRLYNLQWGSNCSSVYTKHMWSAGWGSDLSNIADGLLYGLDSVRPFQVAFKKKNQVWHYAALKNGSKAACASKDMFCYFLPLSRCESGKIDPTPYRATLRAYRKYSHWIMPYIRRPQQWLRHRTYNFIKESMEAVSTPCAALHVRRGDIVLHGNNSRKYYPVSDYLALLPNTTTNIMLFTDDANAIEEARGVHPEYNWMYVTKKRYRGKEGGWQEHFPSGDPTFEVIALMAELKLAGYCDTLVHTVSSFSDVLYDEMTAAGKIVTRLKVDAGKAIESPEHTHSAEELTNLLELQKKHLK